MRRLLDDDPIINRKRIMHLHDDGGFTIQTVQDFTDLVEQNKETAKELDGQRFKGDGMHHIGQIPFVFLEELKAKGILGPGYCVQDQKRFAAWLNDSDNRYLRTRKAL